MAIVIRRKVRTPTPEPVVGQDDDVSFVTGYTREQSAEIARKAVRGLIVELAKKKALSDYQRLYGPGGSDA